MGLLHCSYLDGVFINTTVCGAKTKPYCREIIILIKLTINGNQVELDADPAMPLLYAIRDIAELTGTKFGCGLGLCGACTVHLDGQPVRSCVTTLSAAAGKEITTIEGLENDGQLHPVQAAWIDNKVPQCGYCQSGQMMSAVALLESNPNPNDSEIETAMQGNICRCGTYPRIRKAIKQAAKMQASAVIVVESGNEVKV